MAYEESESKENTSLMAGFRRAPLPRTSQRMPGKDVQMMNKILIGCKFESWPEFDPFVSNIASELCDVLDQQGCRPGNQRWDRCCGEFRNMWCLSWGCRKVAQYKHQLEMDILLDGLVDLAKKLRRNWNGNTRWNGHTLFTDLNLTQAVYPYYSIKRKHSRYPDVVIEEKCLNASELLPELGPHCTSLASAYSRCCAKVTEDSELSYELKCMARTVRHALVTTSGYGCLSNDNQAVFVRVTPQTRETRGRIVAAHRVQVSREFKCDGELSVMHGMLAMLVKGFEESSERTENDLEWYFRILEASEVSRNGELIINRSHRGIGNRIAHGRNLSGDIESGLSRERRSQRGLETLHMQGEERIHESAAQKFPEGNGKEFLDFYPEVSDAAIAKVKQAVQGGKVADLSEIEMIRLFVIQSEFLETGASGVILRSRIEGMEVAVKRWIWDRDDGKDVKSDGLAWFLKEILVYKWLAEHEPEILGSVVPRVIAICEYPETEAMLVTEYVGSEMTMQGEKDEWYIDGMKLCESDVKAIEKSAAEGLMRLRQCGIIHGDPRSENLRVERIKEKGSGTRWRTWWIDLGLVQLLDEEKFGDLRRVDYLCDTPHNYGFFPMVDDKPLVQLAWGK